MTLTALNINLNGGLDGQFVSAVGTLVRRVSGDFVELAENGLSLGPFCSVSS